MTLHLAGQGLATDNIPGRPRAGVRLHRAASRLNLAASLCADVPRHARPALVSIEGRPRLNEHHTHAHSLGGENFQRLFLSALRLLVSAPPLTSVIKLSAPPKPPPEHHQIPRL